MTPLLLVVGSLLGHLALGWILRLVGGRRDGRPRTDRVADGLTRLVTDLTMPALIVSTLTSRRMDLAMVGAVLVGLAGLAAAGTAAALIAPRLEPDRRRRGAFLLAATFCNTGFLGIPVAQALWGPGSAGLLTAMLVDAFSTTLLLNTAGVVIALRHGRGGAFDRAALLALLRAPMFLAVPVGLGLQLAEVPIAAWARDGLAIVASPTASLVFVATGMRLRFAAVPAYTRAIAAVAAVRFVVSPAAAWATARALGLEGEVATQAVLEVAMPTALMAPVIAARYGCDPELGPAAVAVTAALSPLAVLAWWALA